MKKKVTEALMCMDVDRGQEHQRLETANGTCQEPRVVNPVFTIQNHPHNKFSCPFIAWVFFFFVWGREEIIVLG